MTYLMHINYRYYLFEQGGEFYLLDRKPTNFWGYIYPPLQWIMSKNVYVLTEEEGKVLQQHNLKIPRGVVISSVLTGGVGIALARVISRLNIAEKTFLKMNFSELFIGLLISLLVAALLNSIIFFLLNKSINNIINLNRKKILKFHLTPQGPKKNKNKVIFVPLGIYLMLVLAVLVYMDSSSLLFLSFCCIIMFVILISSVNVYNNELRYEVKK